MSAFGGGKHTATATTKRKRRKGAGKGSGGVLAGEGIEEGRDEGMLWDEATRWLSLQQYHDL